MISLYLFLIMRYIMNSTQNVLCVQYTPSVLVKHNVFFSYKGTILVLMCVRYVFNSMLLFGLCGYCEYPFINEVVRFSISKPKIHLNEMHHDKSERTITLTQYQLSNMYIFLLWRIFFSMNTFIMDINLLLWP